MAIEVVLGALVVVMLAIATFMALEGIMGAIGAVEIGRCRTCDHLIVMAKSAACPYCRHPRLAHAAHLHLPVRHHGP